jgi:hypothetical protein
MPRDERRRQRSLQKKAAKRKVKQGGPVRMRPERSLRLPRGAAQWPLLECLISHDWKDPQTLVQIIVARRSPEDEIAVAVFLVDLGCLGVKSAHTQLCPTKTDYEHGIRATIRETQRLDAANLDLAAKVIREALAYAGALGFKPDPDYAEAAILLEGADPDAVSTPVPLGVNGKPDLVAGPYDNAPRIMAQLTRAVGAGNFEFRGFVG